MIDITKFFLVKSNQYEEIINTLDIQVSDYYSGLILSNIFAYLVIILFVVGILYVLRKIKRIMRRALS